MRTAVRRPALLAFLSVAILARLAGAEPWSGEGVFDTSGRIVRFYPQGLSAANTSPSYATERIIPAAGEVKGDSDIAPAFNSSPASGASPAVFSVRFTVGKGTSLYGTGEIGGPLLRNGRTSTLWNTDAYGYKPEAESLYQSHPWVLAVRADGTAFGVLADTTWRTKIDLTDGITFKGEGAPFPVYVVSGASPQEVMEG
ncbi:MAG TPA: hypothetical protein VEB22_07240, partial [Phycisphaerales bacterium]|nr:hypothetical protein [Phycisphaerales bacterium]